MQAPVDAGQNASPAQSWSVRQVSPISHPPQLPPQSTSDSSWFWTPSSQAGAAQREATQRRDTQSRSPWHALPSVQASGQVSPQSTAGSRPLRIPSLQLESGQPGPGHSGTSQMLTSSAVQAAMHAPFAQVSPSGQSLVVAQQPRGLPQPRKEVLLASALLPSAGVLPRPDTSRGSKSERVRVHAEANHAIADASTPAVKRITARERRIERSSLPGVSAIALTISRKGGLVETMWDGSAGEDDARGKDTLETS